MRCLPYTRKQPHRSPSVSPCLDSGVVNCWFCTLWSAKISEIRNVLHNNVPRTPIFAAATHCCPQNLRFAAIFVHKNGSFPHMVHAQCTVRAYYVFQHRNLNHPLSKDGAKRPAFTHHVCTKYTAHVLYTVSALAGALCRCRDHCKCTSGSTDSVYCQCTNRETLHI